MDEDALAGLIQSQDGVLSRRQVVAMGGSDNDIETALRRRRWARMHNGVYVDHTGAPTWRQRAWAAALCHWPAALSGRSALIAHGLVKARSSEVIELVVPCSRRVDDPPGISTSRLAAYEEVVLAQLSPPRVRIEHAVLTVASGSATEDAAVAVIADSCQQRRTTPARLAAALGAMTRLPRRRLLVEVLEDVATGAYSALELRYLRDVERAHGLPTGRRQRREEVDGSSGVVFRDVAYEEQEALVELDGRLGHESASDRWADLARDLVATATGRVTLRAGWRQALEPCRLAYLIAQVLWARGWRGELRRCGSECRLPDVARVKDIGGSPASQAGVPPLSVA